MNLFNRRCSHQYEEIGKYYDRIDYGNGTSINAYIVKKCKICGNIISKTIYSNQFTTYTPKEIITECLGKIKANGYVSKIDFFMAHEKENIPWK